MEKGYDPNLFYAKATFNFNEDGKVELISNNQTEDLLILIFKKQDIRIIYCLRKTTYWRKIKNI
ncbi:MAG: hypothetical protein ACLVKE_15355 [Clostridium baratii]